ncbi:MAG: outer membrane beta-barrel protein [Fimbriimonadaceae bacterium]|nr:outer membrane beta-barrel protein [Fimbriimonadaceae bacterium]
MAQVKKFAAAALLVSASALVSAQSPTSSIYARLGVQFPTGSEARDSVARSGFFGAVGYNLKNRAFVSPLASPSVEVFFGNVRGDGNEINQFGLQYVERVPFGNATSTGTGAYFGYGLGLQVTNVDIRTTIPGQGGSGGGISILDARRTVIAGELIVGYRFTPQIFAEASLRLSQNVSGVNTNSLNLLVGYRF